MERHIFRISGCSFTELVQERLSANFLDVFPRRTSYSDDRFEYTEAVQGLKIDSDDLNNQLSGALSGKDSEYRKIEVIRSGISDIPASNPKGRFLIVTDLPAEHFDEKTANIDDIPAIMKSIDEVEA